MTLKTIADFIIEQTNKDIRCSERSKNKPLYKQYYFLLSYKYLNTVSLSEIAEEVNVSHSNVYTQLNKIIDIFSVDKNLESQFNTIEIAFLKKYPKQENSRDFLITHMDYNKLTLIKELMIYKQKHKQNKKKIVLLRSRIKTISNSCSRMLEIMK